MRPPYEVPYDPNFLGDGFAVPLPTLTGQAAEDALEGGLLNYIHYTVCMNQPRRVAAFTAHNIDASRMVRVSRSGIPWLLDERIPEEAQLGPDVYGGNAWDRGHLVRREDVVWGTSSVAREANRATFYYTNAAPQHENFNQDEWLGLEDWVLHRAPEFAYRLCVFTGPILTPEDRRLSEGDPKLRAAFPDLAAEVQIPAAFWKVVVLRDETAAGDDLSAVAFAMRQTDLWNDKNGRKMLELAVYQVTLAQIQEWTGVDFGELGDVDELEWNDSFRRLRSVDALESPFPRIEGPDDIVFSGNARRRRGGRARRAIGGLSQGTRERSVPVALKVSGCGCAGLGEFDAQTAIAALARKIEQLADSDAAAPAAGARSVLRAERSVAIAGSGQDEAADRIGIALQSTRMLNRRGGSRIVGGDVALEGQFPHCVCLGEPTRWLCTGSLIHPRIVVTAAHCRSNLTRVLVGGLQTPGASLGTGVGKVVGVKRVVRHPKYSQYAATRNDLSLVFLDQDVPDEPVVLATEQELADALDTTLAGFGYNDPNAPVGFGTLRFVEVALGPIQQGGDNHSALAAQFGYDPATEFVAGRKSLGQDSCNGDSGGPAYIETAAGPRLAGATSRATTEAENNCGDGGIYVRVGQYRQWIMDAAKAQGIVLQL